MKKFVDYALLEKTEEEGATAVEYGMLVALIAAVIIGAVSVLGTTIAPFFGIQFN